MSRYIEYLNHTIEELKQEEAELIAANRKDEANFVKIRMNICDICKTVYEVVVKKNDGKGGKEAYTTQLTKISENWKLSLVKAREHEDVTKIVIEETKLEMLQQILNKYEELECE